MDIVLCVQNSIYLPVCFIVGINFIFMDKDYSSCVVQFWL